jgi:hypothetical protein
MCVVESRLSRRNGMWLVVANLCLCAGIALGVVMHPAGQAAKDWMDGVRGLLVGLSIGVNLMVVMRARRPASF